MRCYHLMSQLPPGVMCDVCDSHVIHVYSMFVCVCVCVCMCVCVCERELRDSILYTPQHKVCVCVAVRCIQV